MEIQHNKQNNDYFLDSRILAATKVNDEIFMLGGQGTQNDNTFKSLELFY